MLAALSLAAIFGLPGLALLAIACGRGAARWPWPRGVAVSLALGVAIVALAAIALGAVGRFSLGSECALLAGFAVAAFLLGGRRLRWPFESASLVESGGFVFLAVATVTAFCGHPFEMLIGERDATVYTVSGIGLARQGSLILHDEAADHVGVGAMRRLYPGRPGERDGWLRLPQFVKYPGFYYIDQDRTEILAQGLAFLPALIAVFYCVAGVSGAFAAVNVVGVFAVLAVFAAGTALVGEAAALAGATVLAINLIEVWAARYPVAEIAMQMLLFSGFAAALRGDRFGQALAGLLIGAMFFVKVEAALVLVPIVAFGVASLASRRAVIDRAFWIVFAATVATAVAYWIGFQPDYVRSALRTFTSFQRRFAKFYFVMPGSWTLLALVLLVVVASLAQIARSRLRFASSHAVSRSAAVAVALFAVYGYWVRPHFSGIVVGQQMTLVWLAWYLTPVVVVVGFFGLAHDLATRPRADRLFVLGIALTLAGVFLHFTFVNTIHPYLTRRFVPAAVPLVCLFFGHAIVRLGMLGRGSARIASAVFAGVLLAAVVVKIVTDSRPIYRHREYPGVARQLEEFAAGLRDADLVFVSDRLVRNVLGATFEFVYGLPTLIVWPGGYTDKDDLIRGWLAEGKTIRVISSRNALENVPGADEFEPVDTRWLNVRAMRQVPDRFPDEVSDDAIVLLHYAAGPRANPLDAVWKRRGAEIVEQVCRSGVRLLDGDRFLLRRIRARCPAVDSAGKSVGVVVSADAAGEWQKALALYGARFVRHDLGGVILLDAIAPEPVTTRPLSPERWTLEASDGRGSEALAVDGRLDTRWGSKAPQRPGMTFSIGFPEPTDVEWLRIRMGRFAADKPSALAVETSVDGRAWKRSDVPAVFRGLWWNGALPEKSANGDLDLRLDARAVRFVRLVNQGESSRLDWSIAELEIDGRASAAVR